MRMPRIARTDEYLRRLLALHSNSPPLFNELRSKLTAAGLPPARHKPCRCWTRSGRGGYGRLWNGTALEDTHRMSYRLNVGPIPPDYDVLHHCDVTSCWEPTHLWLGTQADNNRDRDAKGRNGGRKLRGRECGPSTIRGARHPRAKLDEDKARFILHSAKTDPQLNVSALARELGVSESLVRGVISGRNWAWLSP